MNAFPESMKQGRRRSFEPPWPVVRMLAEHGGDAQGLAPGLRPSLRGLGFDQGDQIHHASVLELRGQILPAGERRERDRLAFGEGEAVERFPSPARRVLLGPIEPVALYYLTLDGRRD